MKNINELSIFYQMKMDQMLEIFNYPALVCSHFWVWILGIIGLGWSPYLMYYAYCFYHPN